MAFSEGDKVEWDWGQGTAQGVVDTIFKRSVTRKIDGTRVTRNASTDNPAYYIKLADGVALKSCSEIRKA